MKRRLTNGELIIFCEQMGMVLKSGLSAIEGILIMKEDAEGQNEELYHVYERIQKELEMTGIFYDALEETGAFPDYLVHMARIGEQTGNLDEVMAGLASYYDREETMIQDIRTAVTYPLLMLGMMFVILIVMMVKVLPVFAQVYEQMGGQMAGPAAVLLRGGLWMKGYWGGIVLAILLIAAGLWWLLKTEKGQAVFRRAADRFFAMRQIRDMMSGARFAFGISMALRSGMDYDGAFSLVESLVENDERMKKRMVLCREVMETGEPLSKAISEAGIFSGLNARMLYIAERTGETDEALAKIAVQMDNDITVRIQNFVSVLEPTLVVILSVLVGGILLSVMVPLMGILSSLG